MDSGHIPHASDESDRGVMIAGPERAREDDISAGSEMPEIPQVAKLMERVRQQQDEVERIQRGIEAMEITGGSRHDEVQVTLHGNGQVTRVTIDPDALHQYDADELGDIVMEAVNDALRRVAEAASARFRPFIEAASQTEEF